MARTRVNYAYRNLNGAGIWLSSEPTAGLAEIKVPNVFSQSATALYPIGTRLQLDDRVFRYAKAGGDLITLRAMCSYDCRTRSSVDSTDVATAAGSTTLVLDGASSGVPLENAYAGGYVLILTSATLGRVTMRIHGNTKATATSPYPTTLTLEQPLPHEVAANTDCDIFPSRYADVRNISPLWNPVVGVVLDCISSGYYCWVQTWGPCFITCTSTELGDASGDRAAVFSGSDGTIAPADETWNAGTSPQLAGYTLSTADGEGSEWIMLMCDC